MFPVCHYSLGQWEWKNQNIIGSLNCKRFRFKLATLILRLCVPETCGNCTCIRWLLCIKKYSSKSGVHHNIKTAFPSIGSPYQDKTVVRRSYLYNENPYTGKWDLCIEMVPRVRCEPGIVYRNSYSTDSYRCMKLHFRSARCWIYDSINVSFRNPWGSSASFDKYGTFYELPVGAERSMRCWVYNYWAI